jgi:hypothetical protein
MSKFVFLIYHDEDTLEALPPGEMQALVDAALEYDDDLRESGHYIVSNALQPARTARTVRVRGGGVSATDGPFAETKEQLGGFYLLDVKDEAEALEFAAQIPSVSSGSIEVREVMVFEQP